MKAHLAPRAGCASFTIDTRENSNGPAARQPGSPTISSKHPPQGAHAVLESIGGIARALVGTKTITTLVDAPTQEELLENPNDLIATQLHAFPQGFSVESQHFFAFYLLAHGLVTLLLVEGLLKEKRGHIQRHTWRSACSLPTRCIDSPTLTALGCWC
jgi:hypothetical protein